MFARNRFKKEKDVDLFISKTWKEITSSVDLIEMSTNPSMLQLICLLSAQTGKIGKDRAEVFKHYTQYLLNQYHTKHHEGVPYSDKIYKDDLLKCGKLAMFGLKQNHLQLVFSKQEATDVAGSVIFELGFLTELPSIDTDKVKVQFVHKSLQEYLAAFYVVNTHGDEGMKLLMEFCSTSEKLMGSQIILSFIAAMSKKMGYVIQNQIRDYISTWASDDEVDPKSRTSFLIAMLKDNNSLRFPLPAILDIELQNHESFYGIIMTLFWSFFGQKSVVEKFLNMDGRGVKKINIGVGHYNRLGLLLNNSFTSLEELLINYKNTWSKDDSTHLSQIITTNKPSFISITNSVNSLFNKDLITKVILTQHVHTVILKKCQISKDNCLLILQRGHNLKSLIIQECGIEIDAEIAKVVCDLPDETNVDLSGNKIVKMNTKLLASLINKINTQKQIDLSGLNIDINSEIAKAVCDLPDETNVDLSGNKIVKMNTKLLASLINKINTQKQIDLSGLNIDINSEIAKAVCDLPDETQINLSGNRINKLDRVIVELIVTQLRKNKQTDVRRFNIQVDSKLFNAICDIPGDRELDLSENKIFQINPRILMLLIYKIHTMKEIDLSGLNIDIDSEIAKAVCDLPDETQIDLSGNKISRLDRIILGLIVTQIRKEKEINVTRFNIQVDSKLINAIHEIPGDRELDLSKNKIFQINPRILMTLIYKIQSIREKDLSGLNIDIDTELVKCISQLPEDVQIDLSGNDLTKMEAGLLGKVLKYMKKQEKINIYRWGITIDVDIVKALSNMVYLKSLRLSFNTLTPSGSKWLSQSVRSLPQLEELSLDRCDISNDDCVDLVSSISKHCPRLRELDLYGNNLSSGYSQVVDDVSKMNNLRRLRLFWNPCMEDRKKREEIRNRLKISNPQLNVYTGY